MRVRTQWFCCKVHCEPGLGALERWQSDAQLLLKLGLGCWSIGRSGIKMHLANSQIVLLPWLPSTDDNTILFSTVASHLMLSWDCKVYLQSLERQCMTAGQSADCNIKS